MLAIVEIEKKETSFGPPLNIRISPEELKEIVSKAPLSTIQVGEHFYMQMFRNTEDQESYEASNDHSESDGQPRCQIGRRFL